MYTELHFGPFLLDPSRRALFKSGERLPITAKCFDMLLMLVQRRDTTVAKADFLAALWSGTAVEEANVTQSIYSLRKLLGDDSRQHQYIATLAGQGYRFIAPVTESAAQAPGQVRSLELDRRGAWPKGIAGSSRHFGVHLPSGAALVGCVVFAITAGFAILASLWIRPSVQGGLPELEQRQLTSNAAEDSVGSGAISPDGKYLAYADWTGMHVANVELGTVLQVSTAKAADGQFRVWSIGGWFPDGSRFIANALVAGGRCELWLAAPEAGLVQKLQDDAFGWSASPHGSLVAFTRRNSIVERHVVGGNEIWDHDLTTGKAHPLMSGRTGMRYADIKWEHKGKKFAYLAEGQLPGTHERLLSECDANGRGCRTVLKGLNLKSFVPLPDGRLLLSTIEPEPNGTSCNLWVTNHGSERPRRLTDWQGSCLDSLTSTADGSKIAFRKFSALGTTYIGALDSASGSMATPMRFNSSKGQEGPVAWLHDNRTLLLASNRTGHWEVLKQAIGETSARPLVPEPDSTGRPSVTPDGRWILYMTGPRSLDAGSYQGPVRLMRVSAQGGVPVLVTELRNSDDLQCPQRVGRPCVLTRRGGDRKAIVFLAFDPFKGIGPELTSYRTQTPNACRWALSRDGARVAITSAGSKQVDVVSLANGSLECVRVDVANDWNTLMWTANDKGFITAVATSTGMALVAIDLAGRSHILWNQAGSTRSWGIPSDDGRLLAILNWTVDSNIWTVKGF